MAAGAVACVCVLAAGAVMLPHFWRSSAGSVTKSAVEQAPANPPAELPGQSPAAQPPEPQNQADNGANPAALQTPAAVPERPQNPRTEPAVRRAAAVPPVATPSTIVQEPQAQPAVQPPPGPSDEEIEKASDELIKIRGRADAVYSSLNRLRQQQAADGLEVRQDIAAAASRLGGYLQAADRALQSRSLDAARKNMEHADRELSTLETFFGK